MIAPNIKPVSCEDYLDVLMECYFADRTGATFAEQPSGGPTRGPYTRSYTRGRSRMNVMSAELLSG